MNDIIKQFTPNNMFSNLNIVQIILFFAVVVFAVLFGFMLGGCIFYPSAVKSYLKGKLKEKQQREKDKEKGDYYKSENNVLENVLTSPRSAAPAADFDLNDEDFSFDDIVPEAGDSAFDLAGELDIVDVSPESPGEVVSAVPLAVAVDAAPEKKKLDDAEKDAKNVFTEDEFYNALVEKRKKDVPVVSRYHLLSVMSSHPPIATEVAISISERSKSTPFDCVKAGDSTFMFVFVRKKVLQLFIRLHVNTYKATKESVGDLICEASQFGSDWYSWILGDNASCMLITKVLDLAYKYTVKRDYSKDGDRFVRVGKDCEEKLLSEARSYNPVRNRSFTDVSEELNSKYKLDYFGVTEACLFTNSLKGILPASATEYSGNRPAILKAGEHIFGILFESYGVLKLLFRSSEDYADSLKLKHTYVMDSDFPVSRDWKWYSLLVDSTYTAEDLKRILSESYKYVSEFHKKDEMPDSFEEE